MNKLISLTDAYKQSYHKFYPPNTEYVYSYLESRGGIFSETVFFGLQYLLKKYFTGQFCTQQDVESAKEYFAKFFGRNDVFNYDGWSYIATELNGKLPLSIKSVLEGTIVPTNNVLITIENTDPKCYWLTNWVETELLHLWYSITVATFSRECKRVILEYLNKNGTPDATYKLVDFGQRGVSSYESACIGGAAHLINFMATDTLAGVNCIKEFYSSDQTYMPGNSIPATEHSTIISWGESKESEAYDNVLKQYPTGLVACVSDSYNILNACNNIWGGELKDKVMSRDGTLVIRPDSGDPCEIVISVLTILAAKFGYTINSKGYKLLPSQVRIIQGDGINLDSIRNILQNMDDLGWSADNITFGMGGALLQRVNRDQLNFAIKCSNVVVNGKEYEVCKKPIGDSQKKSKSGRLSLVKDADGILMTINQKELNQQQDYLVEYFRNGEILLNQDFDDIKKRAQLC